MRVITGSARGVRLFEPNGRDIRPTTDRVKESIFNILQYDIEGRTVLDLFAGTGQLGIECLSRGAKRVVFIDESADAVELIKKNIKKAKVIGGEVVRREALRYLEGMETFDLIFLDPPYDSNLIEKSLNKIVEFDKLNEGGIILCESRVEKSLSDVYGPYRKVKTYRYGIVQLALFSKISE